jgi:photosystem II stability/assembly factor-like uncharacterized protein
MSLVSGSVKGAIIGAIGLAVAPQLGIAYIGLKAAQFGTRSLADEHNSCCQPASKEGHSEVGVG